MTISGEDARLAMIREILQGHNHLSSDVSQLIELRVDAQDGDDCAVYDLPGGLSLVVGMDFIRGSGFRLFQEGLLSYEDIGYYLVVANVSDIAAMGATPIGITTVIRYTDMLTDDDFKEIVRGIDAAALKYSVPVVGGDIGGYEQVVLAATAFGVVPTDTCLLRGEAIVGDLLCVTGTIGLPSTAITYFTRAKPHGMNLTHDEETILLRSWKRPVAQVGAGTTLAHLRLAHACQDVSDGVKATIDQLSGASKVSFEISEAELPIHGITRKVADYLGVDPTALALSASVDFQLMFTIAAADLKHVQEALAGAPDVDLHVIGCVIDSAQPSYMIRDNGVKSNVPGAAWNQQREDVTQVILDAAKDE